MLNADDVLAVNVAEDNDYAGTPMGPEPMTMSILFFRRPGSARPAISIVQ